MGCLVGRLGWLVIVSVYVIVVVVVLLGLVHAGCVYLSLNLGVFNLILLLYYDPYETYRTWFFQLGILLRL